MKIKSTIALLLASLGIHAPLSHAAALNHTYTAGADWSTATWGANGAPDNADAGDRATFNLGSAGTLTLDTTDVVVGALINSQNTASTTFTLAQGVGTTITLDHTGGLANPVGATDFTSFVGNTNTQAFIVATNLVLSNTDATLSQAGGSTFNVTGAIDAAAGQTRNLFLRQNTVTTGINFTLSGAIGAGQPTSTLNILNQSPAGSNRTVNLTGAIGAAAGVGTPVTITNNSVGTGTFAIGGASGTLNASVTAVTQNSTNSFLLLNGTNTNYAGTTTINAGRLSLGSATALGTSNLIINGGSMDSTVFGLVLSTAHTQAWNGDFGFFGTNPLTMSTGAVTLGGNRTINVGSTAFVIPGAIGDSGSGFGITKIGSGASSQLILTGVNTYSGATVVGVAGSAANYRILEVGGASGSILASSSYTVHGTGSTLFLNNTAGNTNRLNDTTDVSLKTGAVLSLTGNATNNSTETIGAIGIDNGNETVTVTSAANRVTTLAASAISRGNKATALVRGTGLDQSVATNVSRITLGTVPSGTNFVGTNTLNNGATNDSTKALAIIPWLIGDTAANGTGINFVTYDTTLGLRILNATEGDVLEATSTTQAAPVNAIAFNGSVTEASGITVNSLLFNTAATLDSSGASTPILTINSGALAQTTNTAGFIGSGWNKILLGNNEGVATVTQNSLTINAPLDVTGGGGLIKTGSGTLILNASALYSGGTTVNQGIFQIGDGVTGGTLSAGSGIVTVNPQGTLALNLADGGIFSSPISTSGTVTKTLGANTNTLSGNISDATGVTQNIVGGTLVLSGNNTYSGATTITNGILTASGGTAIGDSSTVTLGNNAGAIFNVANNESIGALAGGGTTGGLVSLGSNTLTVGGTNLSSTYSGALSGSGSLIKEGTGTFALVGNSSTTWVGATIQINGGILAIGTDNAGDATILSPTTTVSVGASGTATFFSSQTIGGLIGSGTVRIGNSQSNSGSRTLTINNSVDNLFNGAISLAVPAAQASIVKGGSGKLTLDNVAATGIRELNVNAGEMVLSGSTTIGAIANRNRLNVGQGAAFTVDNTVTNVLDRLSLNVDNNTAGYFRLQGGTFNFLGNSSANSSESMGVQTGAAPNAMVFDVGADTINLQSGTGYSSVVTFRGSYTRNAGASILIRGTNLGMSTTGTADSTNMNFTTNAPGLTGGGGAAATPLFGILKGVIADSVIGGIDTYGIATYVGGASNAAIGVRRLDETTEYAANITDGAVVLDNIRLTGASNSITAPTTVNSLFLTTGGSIDGAGTLTVNSGTILSAGGANGGIGVTTPGTLAFGTSDAIFHTVDNLTVGSAITGSGGLTKGGSGVLTLSAANGYTGTTNVNAGTLSLLGSLTSPITVANNAALGFTVGSSITTTSTVTFGTTGKVKIFGTPTLASYTLISTTGITGVPTLESPVAGYALAVEGNDIKLNAVASGYGIWKAANAGGQDPSEDFDNDGVDNGAEYFMNSAPGFTANPALVGGNTVTFPNGGNIPASAYGSQYVVQTSSDLIIWTDVPVGNLTTNTNGPGGSLTYTLTGSGPRFMRLKVTPN